MKNTNQKTIKIIYFVLIYLIAITFKISYVPTESMFPTISPKSELVWVLRPAYQPHREDVVVFYKNIDGKKLIVVKRCMGLPGEVIKARNGEVFINNIKIDEPYLANAYSKDFGPYYIPQKGDIVRLNGSDAYIGDYRVGDKDFINTYCEKADEQYIVKNDCFFVLGDNTDLSHDSRFWDEKYVKKSQILGEALFILNPLFYKSEPN